MRYPFAFFADRRGRRSLQDNIEIYRRGDSRIARFGSRYALFRTTEGRPYESHKILAVGACIARPQRFIRFFAGCRGRHPLPADCLLCGMRSFSGAPRHSPTGWFFIYGNLFVFGPSRVSLRLGHAHVLTVHRTVIHCARAASLRQSLQ